MPLQNLRLLSSESELVWRRVSADVMMVRIKARSSQSRGDPESLWETEKDPERHRRQKQRFHWGVYKSRNPKERGKSGRKAWEDYPCEPLKGGQHRGHLDLELLASNTTRGYVYIVLSHQISGDWLLKSQETQRLWFSCTSEFCAGTCHVPASVLGLWGLRCSHTWPLSAWQMASVDRAELWA